MVLIVAMLERRVEYIHRYHYNIYTYKLRRLLVADLSIYIRTYVRIHTYIYVYVCTYVHKSTYSTVQKQHDTCRQSTHIFSACSPHPSAGACMGKHARQRITVTGNDTGSFFISSSCWFIYSTLTYIQTYT